eukprot:NODE_4037_length_1125_cov_105.344311_g3843_i0.p1 GENE.NODE_4037_length_1125_cov_105.344311_g3843_i0~~NODE_4037_length_1125_cov_105.344311_g3843_i0.p1  ORF type:complete len:340 (-),score=69.83 NODE_4037_length_1125_cov_105.344311_g3843_i0:106-1074(-)
MLSSTVLVVAALAGLSVAAPAYTMTPSGYVLSHCTHTVPHGVHLVTNADGSMNSTDGTIHIPVCKHDGYPVVVPSSVQDPVVYAEDIKQQAKPTSRKLLQLPPDYRGWLSYTEIERPSGFTAFTGYFSVPKVPAHIPQRLFIFTGVQNIDWIPKHDPMPSGVFDVVQPVLQAPSDLGYGWSVKSWLVTLKAGAIETKEIIVHPGEKIWGNMTQTRADTWYCGSAVGSPSGKTTSFTHTDSARLRVQPFAYTTIECYGCNSCESYPVDTCDFTDMVLRDSTGRKFSTIPWNVTPKKPAKLYCDERVSSTSNQGASVTYSFQKQ